MLTLSLYQFIALIYLFMYIEKQYVRKLSKSVSESACLECKLKFSQAWDSVIGSTFSSLVGHAVWCLDQRG